jgi:hypothetical protein
VDDGMRIRVGHERTLRIVNTARNITQMQSSVSSSNLPFEVDPAELNPKIPLATINIHNCIVTTNKIAFSMQMYSD